MKNSFYDYSLEFRTEVISYINSFDVGKLYQKEAYHGDRQLVQFTGEYALIDISQERMLKFQQPHRTNTIGQINVQLIEIETGDKISYSLEKLKEITEWDYTERPLRAIVPSDLLADVFMDPFVKKVYNHNLNKKSKDNFQFIYFNIMDKDSEDLIQYFPQIIIEPKPI